jgi:hypothetical protein
MIEAEHIIHNNNIAPDQAIASEISKKTTDKTARYICFCFAWHTVGLKRAGMALISINSFYQK